MQKDYEGILDHRHEKQHSSRDQTKRQRKSWPREQDEVAALGKRNSIYASKCVCDMWYITCQIIFNIGYLIYIASLIE